MSLGCCFGGLDEKTLGPSGLSAIFMLKTEYGMAHAATLSPGTRIETELK